ncbi:Cyp4d2 [Symbiodinium sp. CCMP2592]|nr:Cyp4d2 [Symbiodinium sp. CCMP2592]
MESYIPAVEHVTQQLLTELDKDMSAQGSANFTELLLFFGADVFSKTSLGQDLSALESRTCEVFADVKALSLAIRRRLMWRLPYWKIPWLARWIDGGADASERMHNTLEEIMRKARTSGNTKNTIGQKLTEMVGDRFSHRELLDTLTVLFMGGAETTSTVLGWAFYHLSRDQELQEQVAKEVRDLPRPEGTSFLSFAQLKSLLWVQAVWLEALRCHGPAGYMPLEAAEQVTLLGRKVPAGTSVWIATRNILMNDPEVTKRLGDDLHLYRPSRWLGKEGIFDFAPFNDLGYGHGPRICVGMPLANYEAQLVIARVIQLFVLHWGTKAPLEQTTYGITCNMASGAVSINLHRRN